VTTPADRAFAVFPRGYLRDVLLAQFRVGLRKLLNPETGNVFTDDEVSRATQRGGRWWIQADADDLVLMAAQARGLWLAQQIRPERAARSFLYGYHGDLWKQDPLPAAGGSGVVLAHAAPKTVFYGSSTVPDPAALTARDVETGLRFQVLTTARVDNDGAARVSLIGIDTGESTNLEVDSVLKWEAPPLGADSQATVVEQKFTGGRAIETDAEYADRLRDNLRHKQAAGNRAHFRGWARSVSSSVLDAYVYACAMHAGTTLVCLTQGRQGIVGPNALAASLQLLATVTKYLVPPASPVVPERVFVLVRTFQPLPSDLTLRLSLPAKSDRGWKDATPWPGYVSRPATVQEVTDTSTFVLESDTTLPPDVTAPPLMWWNAATSRFVALQVLSAQSAGGGTYTIVLSTPQPGIAVGDWISPTITPRDPLALAVETYFDSLGPGEVVDLASDTRSDRAARFPDQTEEATSQASLALLPYLIDALGVSPATAIPAYSVSTPPIPVRAADGPFKLVVGRVGAYPID